MNGKKLTGILILLFVFIMGCSEKSGKIKTQSKNESKITQQVLFDNWSDYTIWLQSTAVVFDPKNDDRTILVSSHWGTVKDQAAWIYYPSAAGFSERKTGQRKYVAVMVQPSTIRRAMTSNGASI